MTDHVPDTSAMSTLLKGSPSNWNRWGADDEVGALNFLGPAEVLAAAQLIQTGMVFTLQPTMASPTGDLVWPGRASAQRFMVLDKSDWDTGEIAVPGGAEYADDYLTCFLQGSTQIDALGHVWFDDQMWNGYPASSTVGRMRRAGVVPIAERGIVGPATLLDFAGMYGVDSLDSSQTIGVEEIRACERRQGVEVQRHDILVLHFGWLDRMRRLGTPSDYSEPGLVYSPELVEWFHEREIPLLCSDTLANETYPDPHTGFTATLHCALMRNLGVVFNEANDLTDLAAHCAADGRYRFMYVAAPLNVHGAAGSPVNPVVIK